jgi:hypothetical protein
VSTGLNVGSSTNGHNWGMGTILPGLTIAFIGLLVWMFLVVAPRGSEHEARPEEDSTSADGFTSPVAPPPRNITSANDPQPASPLGYVPPTMPPINAAGSAPSGASPIAGFASTSGGGSSSLVADSNRHRGDSSDGGRRGPAGRTISAPHARSPAGSSARATGAGSQGSDDDIEAGANSGITSPAPLAPEDRRLASDGDGFEDDSSQLTFLQALKIPGVIPFSLSLFFAKLVAYSMLFWLPKYLTEVHYNDDEAAQLASFFDIGGIAGGVLTGYLSDKLKKPAIISVLFLLLSIPVLVAFRYVTNSMHSTGLNIFLMMLAGVFINGPYALITTAVSADLGSTTREATHAARAGAHEPLVATKSSKSDEASIALVTGIIDGTGSLGAAIQSVAIGLVLVLSGDDWGAVRTLHTLH